MVMEEKKLKEEEEVKFRRRIMVEEICVGRGGHGRRCNAGRSVWSGLGCGWGGRRALGVMRVDEMGMQVEIEIANREAGAHSTHTHTHQKKEREARALGESVRERACAPGMYRFLVGRLSDEQWRLETFGESGLQVLCRECDRIDWLWRYFSLVY